MENSCYINHNNHKGTQLNTKEGACQVNRKDMRDGPISEKEISKLMLQECELPTQCEKVPFFFLFCINTEEEDFSFSTINTRICGFIYSL